MKPHVSMRVAERVRRSSDLEVGARAPIGVSAILELELVGLVAIFGIVTADKTPKVTPRLKVLDATGE
jgi:hypothetical protein